MFLSILISLFKGYLVRLATKDVLHYVLMEVGEALVKSTKTEKDDKWFAKFKDVVESDK